MGEKPFSVAVIGGGLAGLGAAAALSGRGLRVELFETRSRFGGRAGAFLEPTTGQWIDFGQHVLLGCCTQMLHFCQQTGLAPFLRRYKELYFLDGQGRPYRFRAAAGWPAPVHLLPSLLRLGFLSWTDRLKTVWTLTRLARQNLAAADLSLADWLHQQGQTPKAVEHFWTPVILSALADLPERVAFSTARKVFTEGFLLRRTGYHLLRPTLPWGQLLDEPLADWFTARRVLLHRKTPVRRIEGDSRRVHHLLLADGTQKTFDFYILAVPWRQIARFLCSDILETIPLLSQAASWESGAITTWHVWLDRTITDLAHAAVVGKAIQWVFGPLEHDASWERPRSEENTPRKWYHYQVVLSGTHVLTGQKNPQTVEELLEELADLFPAVQEAKLLAWRRVRMAEAVFCPRPGLEVLRPGQRTPLRNLALAGDWTATGWPATLEGAVRSGYLAAEVALEQAGIPQRLLAEEKTPGWLARWVVRLPSR